MDTLEEYTKTASTELRKVIFGLIAMVFGVAYTEDGFYFKESDFLLIALIIFFLYFLLDLFQYIIGARMTYNDEDENKIKRTTLFFFSFKIIFGIIGILLFLIHIIF